MYLHTKNVSLKSSMSQVNNIGHIFGKRHTEYGSLHIHRMGLWHLFSHVQGGVESWDALSLKAISRKRALRLVALLRTAIYNLRHLMYLRHNVMAHQS